MPRLHLLPRLILNMAAAGGRELLKFGGIVSSPLATGQQWDSPNGWAPLQWVAIAGLPDDNAYLPGIGG